MKYYFYIMENIKTKERRITSIHNQYNDINQRKSKDIWVIVSNCLDIQICNNRKEYLKVKERLQKSFL